MAETSIQIQSTKQSENNSFPNPFTEFTEADDDHVSFCIHLSAKTAIKYIKHQSPITYMFKYYLMKVVNCINSNRVNTSIVQ